ncbi:MAG TPA: integrase [Phycisphaerae bacterium]|nr:integrase [Phycisphaerae bacterium]
MASIVTEKDGRRLIQLSPNENRKRPKIRLGKVSKREAEAFRGHIENLVRASSTSVAISQATADWLANLPDALRDRIETAGLIGPRDQRESLTLAEWLRKYIAGRTDVKASTIINYEQVERDLIRHFGQDRMLESITAGCAEDFRIRLKADGLAEGTIRRRCKRAKQFFMAAVKRKIIDQNPFADMKCGNSSNPERYYFIRPEDMQKVLDACPDVQWRLLFALARYGGLRMPSELLPLKWADVDFATMRFVVHSPKTAHQGKAFRTVPIFPQLYPMLLEAFEEAEAGQENVITMNLSRGTNLRTQACRIIRRAGLEPWPKLFQNLRSTRETELAEEYPVQVVCEWIGNSPAVAAKHYLQVTDDHYKKAVQNPVHDPVQTAHVDGRQEMAAKRAKCVSGRNVKGWLKNASPCKSKGLHSMTPRGLEPRLPG